MDSHYSLNLGSCSPGMPFSLPSRLLSPYPHFRHPTLSSEAPYSLSPHASTPAGLFHRKLPTHIFCQCRSSLFGQFHFSEMKCLIFLCFQLISVLCQYGEGSKLAFYYNLVTSTNCLHLQLQVRAGSRNYLLKKIVHICFMCICWSMSLKVTFVVLTPPWLLVFRWGGFWLHPFLVQQAFIIQSGQCPGRRWQGTYWASRWPGDP